MKKPIIAAYVHGGMKDVNRADLLKMTHLNHAFARISTDGVLDGKHLTPDIAWLKEFKQINPGLKTLISIGGWGADGFSQAARTKESRDKFVKSAVEFMLENNYDGIDLDWEYPCSQAGGIVASPEDKQNFTLLIQAFRERLDDLGDYLLAIAAGASQSYVDNTELDVVSHYLDMINLMTYDFQGFSDFTGHHANLYSSVGMSGAKAVDLLQEQQVELGKIVLGAAFYGRVWRQVKNSNHGLYQPGKGTGETFSYSEIQEKKGFSRYWDEESQAPYLFDGETFISYEDEESLAWKAHYVLEKGLGGLMFWQYSHDKSGSLLDRIFRELYQD